MCKTALLAKQMTLRRVIDVQCMTINPLVQSNKAINEKLLGFLSMVQTTLFSLYSVSLFLESIIVQRFLQNLPTGIRDGAGKVVACTSCSYCSFLSLRVRRKILPRNRWMWMNLRLTK